MDILQKMLEDREMKPRALPFHLIKDITNNFSSDNKIGSGGCGDVYKGILQNDEVIAVKKLYSKHGNRDTFMDELQNLMTIKHQNIVRFIGYCNEATSEHENIEGQYEMAVASWERLLCFEYLHNGSLDSYLSGKSHKLDWDACYRIIRGVCEGLKYLHEIPMYHLDLKPANILLDEYMMPKIADFGLSRLSENQFQTIYTKTPRGTLGFMAPEITYGVAIKGKAITDKADIYSLGVIIIHMMVGYEDCPKRHEMPPQKFEKLVMEKLFDILKVTRFQNSTLLEDKNSILLKLYCEQGRKCFETALKCMDNNRSNRPSIHDVIHVLDETENTIQSFLEPIRPNIIEILDIHPMELRFPFKENASTYCPLHITNKTDGFIGYFIVVKKPERYQIIKNGSRGVVVPRSTSILIVERQKQQQQSWRMGMEIDELDILVISMENQQDLMHVMDETTVKKEIQEFDLFQKARVKQGMVHGWVTLMAVLRASERRKYKLTDDKNNIGYDSAAFRTRRSICVHPTERWMLAIDNSGDVIVWKHQTITRSLPFPPTEEFKLDVTKPRLLNSWLSMLGLSYGKVIVTSAKFFVQRPWIVCGDERGDIHVFNFLIRKKVKQFGAHQAKITSLAVHPTQSLVLSSCQDGIIKLWDCEKDWMCTRQFAASSGDWCYHLTFNPNDNVTFAAGFISSIVKIWNIHSDSPTCTLPVSVFASTSPFVSGNRPHLVTSDNNKIHIWDYETGRCIKQLTLRMLEDINTVVCHPSHPVIVAGSPGGGIAILNATTFRLENIDSVLASQVQELGFINSDGFASLVIRCMEGMSTETFEVPAIISQQVDSI